MDGDLSCLPDGVPPTPSLHCLSQLNKQPASSRTLYVIGSPAPGEVKAKHPFQFVEAAVYRGLDSNTLCLVEKTWKNPRTGVEYPARWRIVLPSRDLSLEVAPALADQELPVTVRYWEGAVRLSGKHEGQPVGGRGYVELTGYGDTPPPAR